MLHASSTFCYALVLVNSRYPTVPVMALTATASNNMRKDIVENLKLRDPFVSIASLNRPNLHYYVRKKDGKSIQAR